MGSGSARYRASRKKSRQPAQGPSWQSSANPSQSFTLSQEAQNTHRSAWNVSSRLRDNAIKFVSGGKLHQDQPEKPQDGDTVENDNVPVSSEEMFETPSTELDDVVGGFRPQPGGHAPGICSSGSEASITEKVGRIDLSATREHSSLNRTGSNSSSSAVSSGDVIVFAGRGRPPREPHRSPSPHPHPVSPPSSKAALVDPINAAELPTSTMQSRLKPDVDEFVPGGSADPAANAFSSGPEPSNPGVSDARPRRRKGKRNQRYRRLQNDYEDDEEVIQDYIENVMTNQDTDGGGATEDQGSSFQTDLPTTGMTSEQRSTMSLPHGEKAHLDWTSDDLRDFDELGTSEDEIADIGGVYSRRTRPSGLQYLVTPAGRSTDDAKWVPHDRLTSTAAVELVVAFEQSRPNESTDGCEDNEQDHESDWSDSSEETPEEQALGDLIRDQEAEHDDNEQLLKRASKLSDAELARILNKQAELGYGTDEVILFDGACGKDEDFTPFSTQKNTSNRTHSKRNRRSKDAFPSAEAFADVLDEDPYNGFDVMDFDRPSLKPKKKGRKSANSLPFELEDEELADQIARSWANDRAKKSARKVEREELRQAGLLGSKSAKGGSGLDPRAEFTPAGMDMDQVKSELRAFLMHNARDSLTLPAMANGQRAQVHLLAKALRLKSASYGKGDGRFPVLTKTDFSGGYDEYTIGEIDALLAQRRFSTAWGKRREDGAAAAGKVGGARPRGRRGGGGGGVAAGATYMDGEVVGAAAPELGTENKGRALLEKMGWSSGMGIGKVGNQGSVEVIKHVVKNTKAGLG